MRFCVWPMGFSLFTPLRFKKLRPGCDCKTLTELSRWPAGRLEMGLVIPMTTVVNNKMTDHSVYLLLVKQGVPWFSQGFFRNMPRKHHRSSQHTMHTCIVQLSETITKTPCCDVLLGFLLLKDDKGWPSSRVVLLLLLLTEVMMQQSVSFSCQRISWTPLWDHPICLVVFRSPYM